jgi:ribose transport system substrate-binding protein
MHNPYLIAMNRTMDEMAEHFGYELITINAGGDATQQLMDVEDLIALGVDVIVMDAQDPVAAIAKGEMIANAGIPLFLLNASVDPATIFVTIVQSNNTGLGVAVGEWVADQMAGTDIRVGLLAGNPGNMTGYARRTGFIIGMAERQLELFNSTNFLVQTKGWGNWSAEIGMTSAEDMLVAAPDINVIFAENDAMAMGAITAVRNAGREGEVLIVGVDGMWDALELIEEGLYGATGVNSPIELVRMAMQIMVDYMTGVERNIPNIINTTPGLVHAGNVADSWDTAF